MILRHKLILWGIVLWISSFYILDHRGRTILSLQVRLAEKEDIVKIYWQTSYGYNEEESKTFLSSKEDFIQVGLELPSNTHQVRIDLGTHPGNIQVKEIQVLKYFSLITWNSKNGFSGWRGKNEIEEMIVGQNGLQLTSSGFDPFIVYKKWFKIRWLGYFYSLVVSLAITLILLCFFFIFLHLLPSKFFSPSAENTKKKPIGWLQVALLLLSGALSVFIAREVADHFRQRNSLFNKAGDYISTFVNDKGQTIFGSPGVLKLQVVPWTTYQNFPLQVSPSYVLDQYGFRREPLNEGQPKAFVLGGSAAFGHSLVGNQSVFTAHLNELDNRYQYINTGVVGFNSNQELSLMIHRLDDFEPKLYVLFDGWNDLFGHWRNYRDSSQIGWHSTFYKMLDHLAAKGGVEQIREQKKDMGKDYYEKVNQHYTGNLDKMNAFAHSRGAELLVVFQPELGSKKYHSEKEKEMLEKWNRSTQYLDRQFSALYLQMISQAEDFCQQKGIECLNCNTLPEFQDSSETLYLDPVHLNQKAHLILAEVIYKTLLRNFKKKKGKNR